MSSTSLSGHAALRTLFLQAPSFDGFDGGAGSRYQAKREVKSNWFPTWLAQPAALVNALDIALTDGLMPAQMKQTLVSAVQAESGGSLRQVQTAIYLILASGYYNVWH